MLGNFNESFADLFDLNLGFGSAPIYILIYLSVYGFAAIVGTLGNILVLTLTYSYQFNLILHNSNILF